MIKKGDSAFDGTPGWCSWLRWRGQPSCLRQSSLLVWTAQCLGQRGARYQSLMFSLREQQGISRHRKRQLFLFYCQQTPYWDRRWVFAFHWCSFVKTKNTQTKTQSCHNKSFSHVWINPPLKLVPSWSTPITVNLKLQWCWRVQFLLLTTAFCLFVMT